MSNLGMYQWMTATSKKVGGPANFLLLVATSGAAAYKLCEVAVLKLKRKKNEALSVLTDRTEKSIYNVVSDGQSNEGVAFASGEQFRVLETDADSVLIEKLGDSNNPYYVSAKMLCEISDYNN